MNSKKAVRGRHHEALRVFRSGGGDGDYLSRWKRIVELDRKLRDASYPTASELARRFGVSTKTIYRDLEAMRCELDAPIAFDRRHRGYHYTDDTFGLPSVTLSTRDLFALMVAENAVEQYEGTPLHSYLRNAFDRVLSHLPGDVREQHALAARGVHFGGLPPGQLREGVWQDLCAAIQAHEEVELTYHRPSDDEPAPRRVQPLLLVVRDREWFLAAHRPDIDRTPLYYLPRVLDVKRLGVSFAPPDDFSAEAYYRDGFNALRGPGESEEVELRFPPDAAHLVDERAWAFEQSVARGDDGFVNVTFRTAALFAVEREVLHYGGRIEVVRPRSLRESVALAAQRLVDAHDLGASTARAETTNGTDEPSA